ncbi:MAG TPA: ArsR family transcriptional regulator [Spirochaetia bacterium]|nr:ArsR family transcriptional regulator [Spirochaetia bacterium]
MKETPQRTRERILRLLLDGDRTVSQLTDEIGITANAVRAQILTLEKQGLVGVRGQVRGSRRPSATYGLSAGGESVLSRAYPFALSRLVAVLSQRMEPIEFERTMRAMGKRMAARGPRAEGAAEERVRSAVEALAELGSSVDVERQGGTWLLSSDSCPIGEAVTVDGRSCVSMATMLEELTGMEVRDECRHGEHPRCRFKIRQKRQMQKMPSRGV